MTIRSLRKKTSSWKWRLSCIKKINRFNNYLFMKEVYKRGSKLYMISCNRHRNKTKHLTINLNKNIITNPKDSISSKKPIPTTPSTVKTLQTNKTPILTIINFLIKHPPHKTNSSNFKKPK